MKTYFSSLKFKLRSTISGAIWEIGRIVESAEICLMDKYDAEKSYLVGTHLELHCRGRRGQQVGDPGLEPS